MNIKVKILGKRVYSPNSIRRQNCHEDCCNALAFYNEFDMDKLTLPSVFSIIMLFCSGLAPKYNF